MLVNLLIALMLLLDQVVATPPVAATVTPPTPPLNLPSPVPESSWRSLYDSVDPALQGQLERTLYTRARWAKLLRAHRMAVGVVDLTDLEQPRFARLNGNVEMYAASLPKIGILLAAHVAIAEGTLEDTPEVEADLVKMIRFSSNEAATRMIDRLGFDTIERTLTDRRYQLYDPKRGGGLWIGKRYAKSGNRVGDPLQNISHAATVTQVCRFYYLLATGRVISPERSEKILADLADPGLHHKFVGVLELRAPGAQLFRKSGTWKQWHSDSVMVWGPQWRRYILVGMVEDESGEKILRELLPLVEGVLHPAGATPAPTREASPTVLGDGAD